MFLRNAFTLALLAATTLSIGCNDQQQQQTSFAKPDSIGFIGVRVQGNKVQVATMPDILSQEQLTKEQTQEALARADWQDVNSNQIINNTDDVAKASNNSFYFIQEPSKNVAKLQGPKSSSSNVYYGYYPYYRPYGGYYYYSPTYGYNNWYWPTYYTTPYYNYSYWPTYYYSYNWWYYQPAYYYSYYNYNYYWYARWW